MQYLFKQDLQRLATRLGLEIRVAHYPPYCSKHNPIEHRVFPHLTRACQGVIFHTVEIAKQFIERAKTSTGLSVTVDILEKTYATGRQCAEDFKKTMKISNSRPHEKPRENGGVRRDVFVKFLQ